MEVQQINDCAHCGHSADAHEWNASLENNFQQDKLHKEYFHGWRFNTECNECSCIQWITGDEANE